MNKEELYIDLITELKILHKRAEYRDEQALAKRYKKIYQTLEMIREKKHLSQISETEGYKKDYEEILETIGELYDKNKREETIETTIQGIEELCKKKQIEINTEPNKQIKKGIERNE